MNNEEESCDFESKDDLEEQRKIDEDYYSQQLMEENLKRARERREQKNENSGDDTLGIVFGSFFGMIFLFVMIALIVSGGSETNETNNENKVPFSNEIISELTNNVENDIKNEINDENYIESEDTIVESKIAIDYQNESDFEKDINAGKNLEEKVVKFTLKKYVPDSAFGYNAQSGEHLNFMGEEDYKLDTGDVVIGKVKSYYKFLNTWIIDYEKIEIIKK